MSGVTSKQENKVEFFHYKNIFDDESFKMRYISECKHFHENSKDECLEEHLNNEKKLRRSVILYDCMNVEVNDHPRDIMIPVGKSVQK